MNRYKLKHETGAPTRVRAASRPSVAALRAQAKHALREPEGIDFGGLSHAERDKLLFGI